MKKPPKDWPRISSELFYEDAAAAIEWVCRAFGFTARFKMEGEDGTIVHSELELPDAGLIMVGTAGQRERCASPRSLGGANTQSLCVFVDDADAHCAHARAAGATIIAEPTTHDHGAEYWADRTYQAEDLEGHRWWFIQRVRDVGEPIA